MQDIQTYGGIQTYSGNSCMSSYPTKRVLPLVFIKLSIGWAYSNHTSVYVSVFEHLYVRIYASVRQFLDSSAYMHTLV